MTYDVGAIVGAVGSVIVIAVMISAALIIACICKCNR